MHRNHYEALLAPGSTNDLAEALSALCGEAGASHFIAVRMRGHDLGEVAQVLHNGSSQAAERIDAARPAGLFRMIEAMRHAGPPVIFGGSAVPGLDIDGYEHGAAAIARDDRLALIVYFGRTAPTLADAELFRMLSMLQLAAQYGLEGLKALPLRACVLLARELDCLRLYMAGRRTHEMARTLGLSVRAIEGHLDRARVRCGVESTLAVAMVALKEGWVTTAEIRAIQRVA